MKRTIWFAMAVAGMLLVRLGSAPGGDVDAKSAGDEAAVAAVLDDLHAAAAASDGPRYFGHFAPEAVFLGTDASERWTLPEFKAFATPYFAQGKGWAYQSKSRNIQRAPGGDVAWFDEALDNATYGECRGSGVLRSIGGTWKVTQYNLTIPIPNALASEFVAKIRAAARGSTAIDGIG